MRGDLMLPVRAFGSCLIRNTHLGFLAALAFAVAVTVEYVRYNFDSDLAAWVFGSVSASVLLFTLWKLFDTDSEPETTGAFDQGVHLRERDLRVRRALPTGMYRLRCCWGRVLSCDGIFLTSSVGDETERSVPVCGIDHAVVSTVFRPCFLLFALLSAFVDLSLSFMYFELGRWELPMAIFVVAVMVLFVWVPLLHVTGVKVEFWETGAVKPSVAAGCRADDLYFARSFAAGFAACSACRFDREPAVSVETGYRFCLSGLSFVRRSVYTYLQEVEIVVRGEAAADLP